MTKQRPLESPSGNFEQICGDPLTYKVIGLAMGVHTELGSGLDEIFYHRLLAARLNSACVLYQSKPRSELRYRDNVADVFEPDLVIADSLVVELKAQIGGLTAECLTRLLSYLKFWGGSVGLLFDFAKERLIFQRVIYTEADLAPFPTVTVPRFVDDVDLANQILGELQAIYRLHGLGYRDTTYRGLLLAGLQTLGCACSDAPIVSVGELGPARLRCILVNDRCVLTISGLGEGLTATQRAITQTYLRLLRLSWGLEVHFGKSSIEIQFVRPAEHHGENDLAHPKTKSGAICRGRSKIAGREGIGSRRFQTTEDEYSI
jgi:GxxExxY protein